MTVELYVWSLDPGHDVKTVPQRTGGWGASAAAAAAVPACCCAAARAARHGKQFPAGRRARPVSSRWAIVVSTVVEPSSVCSVWAGEASRAARHPDGAERRAPGELT